MDSVLNNINALNRSLEGSIAVGKEFDSVSNLWSNFYDGLAQVEELRQHQQGDEPQQSQEEATQEATEPQGEAPDGEMKSDALPTDPASDGARMDVDKETQDTQEDEIATQKDSQQQE